MNGYYYVLDKGSTTGTFLKASSKIELFPGLILSFGNTEACVFSLSKEQCQIRVKRNKESADQVIQKEGLKIYLNGSKIEKSPVDSKDSIEMTSLNGAFYIEDKSGRTLWIRLSPSGIKSSAYYIRDGDVIRVGSSNIFVSYLKERKRVIGDTTMCKVCYQRDIETVLFPCKHNILCTVCSKLLDKCPLCRKRIKNWIQVFR